MRYASSKLFSYANLSLDNKENKNGTDEIDLLTRLIEKGDEYHNTLKNLIR